MVGEHSTLEVFYQNWKEYMDSVKEAIAPLSSEQLKLRAAANERTVAELAQHIIGARIVWFCKFMGEGREEIGSLRWLDSEDVPGVSASEIAAGLDQTWQLMGNLLDHWTPEDMQKTFPHTWRGEHYDPTRSWVVWHVLEHDLIHGGEISLTLGMHGLAAPRP